MTESEWRNEAMKVILEGNRRHAAERRRELWGFGAIEGKGYDCLVGCASFIAIVYCVYHLCVYGFKA